MGEPGLAVRDQRMEFARERDSLRLLLAQISPAFDRDVFEKEFVVKVRDSDRQAERITGIIQHARTRETDLLLLPELVAPFSHLEAIEDALRGTPGDFVACVPYEHTALKDFLPLLSREEIAEQGLTSENAETRLVNFSRIFIRAGEDTKVFTQIKLTPFSGEFSLSAKDTLVCGNVLHRFITNWGTFAFLICKDYVGEVKADPPIPMFDFLKSLTADGLHYVFVSALNPEPEAFLHAARSFYYLQEKSSRTYSVFLNGAELDHTAIVFPTRPHPGARTGEHVEILPLFEAKPGWGTHVRFPGEVERLIGATLVRLDAYTSIASKEIYSPAHGMEVESLADIGVPWEEITQPRRPEKAPPPVVPHNLPSQATPFVGREEELAHLGDLLENPSCRLVTLVGPGGIGKTRLALEAAAGGVDNFPHGVYFVPLAPVGSPDHLVPTVADSVGFSFYGGQDPKAQLLDYLRGKQALLVMDNFEHLLDGALLVGDVLDGAPGVTVLATSRERLNLSAEWAVEVSGLQVPETAGADNPERFSALQLFAASARRARAAFALSEEQRPSAVRICQVVEGMPLAIELAASWVRALSCEEILEELTGGIDFLATSVRDVPERHRSVRAVFEHSWGLLSEEERAVLMRLTAFRGGFSLDAARKVAETPLPVLSALVDKSLLRWDPAGRYEMHGLLRQYAAEKARGTPGEEQAHRRHSRYYAEFLYQREGLLKTRDERATVQEIAQEIENVREGWSYAAEHVHPQEIDWFADGLYLFYDIRSRFREGQETFQHAVERLKADLPTTPDDRETGERALAKALARQGLFLYRLGRYGEATQALEEGLSAARKLDDRREISFSLHFLGSIRYRLGEYDTARELLEESSEVSAEIADQRGVATSLSTLGHVFDRTGERQKAEELYRQSLTICREIGDGRGVAACLNNLGGMAYSFGRYQEVKELLEETLPMHRELENKYGVATCLNNMGLVTWAMGESEEAKRLYLQSLAIHEEIGDRNGIVGCLNNLGNAALALGEYEEAREYHQQALHIREEIGERRGIATSLNNLGLVEQALGRNTKARELHQRSLAMRDEIGDRPGVATSNRHLGVVAYELGEYEDANRLFRKSLAMCEPLEDQEGSANALNGLGDTARALGDHSKAREHLRAALRTATEISATPVALDSLFGFAALFASEGRQQDALALLDLVASHPMAYQPTKDRAQALQRQLADEVSPEAVAAAERQAEPTDFETIVADLLTETQAGG
jgi:predicted ATPase/Tfp pilus assembly protein PilF